MTDIEILKDKMLPCLQNTEWEKAIRSAIKALEQPCEDCISRAELLKAIDTWDKFGYDATNHLFRLDNLSLPYYVPYIHYDDVIKCIKGLPSVQPEQQQKTGHWIMHIDDLFPVESTMECSECGNHQPLTIDDNYCPNCGAKMEG